MTVRDLQILLSRFNPNTHIDGHTLTALVVKPTKHLVLVREDDHEDLLRLAPNYYESAW